MPIQRKEERQRVRGQEVADRLRKLQGRKEAGLVADKARGPASPLGQGMGAKKMKEKGR